MYLANMDLMKTTLNIQDELLARAKRHAQRTGRPLRAVLEEGLRQELSRETNRTPFRLQDRSVGERTAKNPLEAYSWQDLREIIYGGPGPG